MLAKDEAGDAAPGVRGRSRDDASSTSPATWRVLLRKSSSCWWACSAERFGDALVRNPLPDDAPRRRSGGAGRGGLVRGRSAARPGAVQEFGRLPRREARARLLLEIAEESESIGSPIGTGRSRNAQPAARRGRRRLPRTRRAQALRSVAARPAPHARLHRQRRERRGRLRLDGADGRGDVRRPAWTSSRAATTSSTSASSRTYLENSDRVIRPANYPPSAPGRGYGTLRRGRSTVAVLNLMGRTFMPPVDDPFRCADALISDLRALTPIVIVDMHAEATSEKVAMARFLDGRVSVVFGTHTHVQTADEQILPGGTAYISDVGMTGPTDGVIGMDATAVLDRFLTGMSDRFNVQKTGPKQFCAAVVSRGPDRRKGDRHQARVRARSAVKVDFHSHTLRERRFALAAGAGRFHARSGVETYSISDHDTLSAYGAFGRAPGARVHPRHRDQHDVSRQRSARARLRLPLLSDAASGRCSAHNRAERRKRVGAHGGSAARGAGTASPLDDVEGEGAERQGARAAARRQGAHPRGLRPRHRVGVSQFPAAWKARVRSVHARHAARGDRNDRRGRRHRGARAPRAPRRTRPSSTNSLRTGFAVWKSFYPRHDADEVRFFREKAAEYGLMVTGGVRLPRHPLSHAGRRHRGPRRGDRPVPRSGFRRLSERFSAREAR